MKKIIRLTESDLTNIIKNVISESAEIQQLKSELKLKLGSSFKEHKGATLQLPFYYDAQCKTKEVFKGILLGMEVNPFNLRQILIYLSPLNEPTNRGDKKMARRFRKVVYDCPTKSFFVRRERMYCCGFSELTSMYCSGAR